MKPILNKIYIVLLTFVIFLLTLFFIIGTNYSSFHRTLNSLESCLINKESSNDISYKEIDYIYSKSNGERLLEDSDLLNRKGIYVFKDVPYFLYSNEFFKIELDKNNNILYDEKLDSFYVFDVYKDIINILVMFTIGFLTILFVKIRLKYFKFEEEFKSIYHCNILNKNVFLDLLFIILLTFVFVKCFSIFILSIPTSYVSILVFVLFYVGNLMLKEYKIRKSIFLEKYNNSLNPLLIEIQNEDKKLLKSLNKKYRNYNFNSLIGDDETIIDLNSFKSYLLTNLIDIDKLSEHEKLKLVIEFKKNTDK